MISGIQLKVLIKDLEINRAHVTINHDRRYSYSHALITVNNADRIIEKEVFMGDSVSIYYGYRGQSLTEYLGTILRVMPEKDNVFITVVGLAYPGKKLIKQTWQNETPSAIIKYCLNEIGIEPGRIDEPGCTIETFVASNFTIFHLAVLLRDICHRSYGMDMNGWDLFMDSTGRMNWGDFVEDIADIPVLETGKEMVTHNPSGFGNLDSFVEAFMIPWFKDSMNFKLIDESRGVNQVYRAFAVEHEVSEKVRTRIGYEIK